MEMDSEGAWLKREYFKMAHIWMQVVSFFGQA